MKKISLKIIGILCIVFYIFTSCFMLSGCDFFDMLDFSEEIDNNIENYLSKRESVKFSEKFLPTLEDVGGERISYSYQKTDMAIFITETIALFAEYSPDSYASSKAQMLSSYEILQEPHISSDGDYLTPPKTFLSKGYRFFTCINTTDSYYESNSILFIGYNDKTCRLAYCYFWDSDRDIMFSKDEYPDDAMTEIMDLYFDWNEME